MTPLSRSLRNLVGEIDIYLFDQIARGRFDHCRTVLDAGCGDGRNLRYLLSQGVCCYGIDRDALTIARTRALASTLAPEQSPGQFVAGELAHLPWEDGTTNVQETRAMTTWVLRKPDAARA